MSHFSESIVEEAAIEWFGEPGYSYLPGPDRIPRNRIGMFSVVIATAVAVTYTSPLLP